MAGIYGSHPVALQQPYRVDKAEGEQHRGEERNAAQPGDGLVVDLAGIRDVEKLLAHRDEQDARDKHAGDEYRYDKGKYKIQYEQRNLGFKG